MSNMIVTGGYGQSQSDGNYYADIDWSKSQFELIFNIEANDISFSLQTKAITFELAASAITFGINTTNTIFNMESHDLRFTASMCA